MPVFYTHHVHVDYGLWVGFWGNRDIFQFPDIPAVQSQIVLERNYGIWLLRQWRIPPCTCQTLPSGRLFPNLNWWQYQSSLPVFVCGVHHIIRASHLNIYLFHLKPLHFLFCLWGWRCAVFHVICMHYKTWTNIYRLYVWLKNIVSLNLHEKIILVQPDTCTSIHNMTWWLF